MTVARDEDLGAMLGALARVVAEQEEPILQRHGLSMWEYVILVPLVKEGALSQSDLAARSRRDTTRLIGHLDRLAERGLIARDVDRSDRRRRSVRLTDAGRSLLDTVRTEIRSMEDDLLAGAPHGGADLRASLTSALRTLRGT